MAATPRHSVAVVGVEVERLTGVDKNLLRGVVSLVHRCRAVGGPPAPADESAEVGWLPLDEAVARMTPAFAVRVRDAVTVGEGPPAGRAHDGVHLR